VEIDKKFKGKVPLTVCRLTGKARRLFPATRGACWISWAERPGRSEPSP